MESARSKAVRVASSHFITTGATLAATLLFVVLGSRVTASVFSGVPLPDSASMLKVALLLNVAIILFGWRRAKDLAEALQLFDAAERLAERNANTDPTTGLANRRELMRALGHELGGKRGAVLLVLDLDHFKRINDLHGHLAGDRVLRFLAEVLLQIAPKGACCARTGGDEFAMLLPGATERSAEDVAHQLLARLATPVDVEGAHVQVSASVGLATLGGCADDESALRQSDVALYAAKRSGRNGFAWFDQELEIELADRLQLEEDIRLGIKCGEFVPYFQPLIDLSTKEIAGFEALARWKLPHGQVMDAEKFIEAAERTGLIGPLTWSIMEQALAEARTWPGHLRLAINISPVQFRDPALAEKILTLLAKAGFPASRLELEITESSLLEDREQVIATIQSLKNVGVRISLDDFGTGYASLAQVNSLPLDRIKIDKSFITSVVHSERTAEIVNTIASLGHTLDVPITAEGVESELIRSAISRYGCTEAQGWLYGRPVSADAVRQFLDLGAPADAIGEVKAPDETVAVPEPARMGRRRGSRPA